MIRISLVDYLNSAPLGWSFLHGPLKGQFEVLPASPARCADQLASGEADIGLIPSIEFQRIPGLKIIPGIAIAALDKVRSVLLVRPKGAREIRRVALDTSSRTSVALVRILLELKLGIRPDYLPHSPDLAAMLSCCDAALLIGDAALQLSPEDYEIMDLAEEWANWQRRPFVFAFWACRSGLKPGRDLVQIFQEARSWGLAARDQIVGAYSRKLALPPSLLEDYLYQNINYNLDPPHIEGLEMYYRLAHRCGLIPEVQPLRLLPSGVAVESNV